MQVKRCSIRAHAKEVENRYARCPMERICGAEDEDVDEEGGEVDEKGAVEEEASVAGAELSSASSLAMSRTSRIMSCRAVMISSENVLEERRLRRMF